MKTIRSITFIFIVLSLAIGTTGCLKTKQVRYSSLVPDFPVSPRVQDTTVSTSLGQKTFSYRYYPSTNVYFDRHRKVYFYSDGEDWHEGEALPGNQRINSLEFVLLELSTDKPYLSQEAQSPNPRYMEKGMKP